MRCGHRAREVAHRHAEGGARLVAAAELHRQRSDSVPAPLGSRVAQKMLAECKDVVGGEGAKGATVRNTPVLAGPRVRGQLA